MKPRLACGVLLSLLATTSCTKKDDEPPPTVFRWDVTPAASGGELTARSFVGDYGKSIYAERHRFCRNGILGIGDTCGTVDPGLDSEVEAGHLEIRVRDEWKVGPNEVTDASYTPPGQDPKQAKALRLANAVFEVTSFRRSTTIWDSDKRAFLAWLCARGSADVLDDQGQTAGRLRFAIDYRNSAATDNDSPACDAEL